MWREVGSSRAESTAELAERNDALWRSASSSLFASREWIMREMQAGRQILYSRAVVDRMGKLTGKELLKATLMNEFFSGAWGAQTSD
jgi:hypothetical protein